MKLHHGTRLLSLLLSLCLLLGLCPTALAAGETGAEAAAADDAATEGAADIDGSTLWYYWDYEADPADPYEELSPDEYDRTSWTAADYGSSEWFSWWSSGSGSFGAKYGDLADLGGGLVPDNLLYQYKYDYDNEEWLDEDIEAYFFRTAVTVGDASAVTAITGSVVYDDSATVYINGVKIAGFDDEDITGNMQYGGSNAGTPKTGAIDVTDSALLAACLVDGENIVAVEVHQGRSSSSDVYFAMPSLTFAGNERPVEQTNISLSMGADPTQMNFTWYANVPGSGTLTLAREAELTDGVMPAGAKTFSAEGTASNKTGYYSYQTTVTELEPDTVYAYQLTNGEKSSEIYTFTTDDGGDAFSFAFVADPQIGASGSAGTDAANWDNTLRIIAEDQAFQDISFLISAGDQVNKYTASDAQTEQEYDGYLEHELLNSLPVATTVGNHDALPNYGEHFNVPNESSYGATSAGGDYYFVYNGALFLMLNSNSTSTAEHKAFMEAAIEENPDVSWKIVVFHHSIYSVASHALENSIIQRRNELVPVFQELDIDVVLMGHDHVYCRTYMMDGLTEMTDASIYDGEDYSSVTDPTGILYVTANSSSGSKYYAIQNADFPYACVKNQENVPNVSRVDISDTEFTITTYRTTDMSEVDSFTIYHTAEDDGTEEPAKLLIDQVYGGGGKGDTPISNSFVELYNPNEEDVSLEGYTLACGGETLALEGTIPAHGSFLVVGAAEDTSDEYLTYDLPEADQTWDLAISNKNYTVTLSRGGTEVDSVTADEDVAAVKVSKQKSLKRIDHADTDSDGDFQIIVWEKAEVTVDEAYVSAYAPRNSAGEYGGVHGASAEPDEPVYTPAITGDTRVTGYYDETGSLRLELAGRFNSGAMSADGGSLEIVAYNPVTGYAYAVSGVKGKLIAVSLNEGLDGGAVVELTGAEYDVKSLVDGFTYGDMTSVAVSPDGSKLAAAIQAENYADNGVVALFTCNADGSLELAGVYPVGVQPDMVVFADNDTILTADEGEPREGYGEGTSDPAGTVSIVRIGTGASTQVGFEGFTADELTAQNIILGVANGAVLSPAADLEPEYIAVSSDGKTAYVTLQEANAIAVLDVENGVFTGIYSCGYQDYGTVAVDLTEDGGYAATAYKNLVGARMPDGISIYESNGKTYLLTANEGDAREWGDYTNEAKDKSFTGSSIRVLDAALCAGLPDGKSVMFGSRSFTIYEAAGDGLIEVYDSGSGFESITAEALPDFFNCSNDDVDVDSRSPKKGPEPESVTVGAVDGKTYAFIALERIGGVMVYDVTDPENASFVNYINSREFDSAIQGDVSPEGLCFVSAADSKTGKPLLLAACEVSGTLAVYELTAAVSEPGDEPVDVSAAGVFTDVDITDPDNWYALPVAWAVLNGVAKGTTDTTFSPDQVCTRAQAVTFLWRAAGAPTDVEISAAARFTDVDLNAYYAAAVAWAVDRGITVGTSATAFSPDEECTRAQIVTFLYRYEGEPEASGANPFADVAADEYYTAAVSWAAANGITVGTTATTFSPDEGCTRAQIVAFLYRDMANKT